MEKFPGSRPHSIESTAEKILTKEEVLEAISEHVEGFTVGHELSDEAGVYLLEGEVPGDAEGEVIEYQYIRKGRNDGGGRNNPSVETAITATWYRDGVPFTGGKVAIFNDETGEWKKC